ncbi:MAG: ATP-binding protein [bacterium]
MIFITGLRRVGKTTSLFQLIDWLIRDKHIAPEAILYYSFDEARYDLEQIFNFYQSHILQDEIQQFERIYVFLDEIQKLPAWPDKVKMFYDMHPNIKMILSGSANLVMKAGSRESLAGRFFDYTMTPLDFPEFLTFRGVEVDPDHEIVFQQTITREFQRFLKTGGFIEAITYDDLLLINYFKDSILERVAYRDIPDIYSISVPDLLIRLLNIFAQWPGMYLDYKNLANDLQFDQRTITNYLNYLEYSYLVQKLYNFSTNLLTSEKKLKRAYLSNTGFTNALANRFDLPVLLEQFWINFLKSKYFFRSPHKDEVDLVLVEGRSVLPIEIKIRESITAKMVGSLFKFLSRFKVKRGLLISKQTDKEFNRNDQSVRVLPYWRYWSILKHIDELTKDK